MRKLEIPVKFRHGDIIYTTKQVRIDIPCPICEGKKTIKYNNKDMKCPECMGTGKFISKKLTNIVCDELFTISSTKISINSNEGITVKYKGSCGVFTPLNRAEGSLFSTKEEAQIRCDELNKEKKFIKIEDIIIQDCFKESHSTPSKIQVKLDYYILNKKFDKDIIIDKANILQDGYITYLLCKLLNIESIKVVVESNIEVKGVE